MMYNPVAQIVTKAGPVLVASLILLLQCLAGLSSQADLVSAQYSSNTQYLANTDHRVFPPASLMRQAHQKHSAPAMSCCDDGLQPITLADVQLIPLLLLFVLLLRFDLLRVSGRIIPTLFSPNRRLHRLYCCWLN
ncbi:hypothetical protein [Oceanospirillum maris]|uniref:hypothetical protein n=1 Tax=Oceanospirillum maris TaxID=64977 RepID=UPI00040C39A6|nr:hypothetical protein [Oceanospirillum maris]